VARRQLGCGNLQSVLIGPTEPRGNDPNWEVVQFVPDLPPLPRLEALKAIVPLRQKYALSFTDRT
jgi:hypothetical protein